MTIKKLLKRIPGVAFVQYEMQQRKALQKWIANGKPVPPPHIVKALVVVEHSKKFGARTLVETGTFLGHMIDATKNYFDKIISIELAPELAAEARQRFGYTKKVQIVEGDSGKEMPKILKGLNDTTIFWLDAHYSGAFTAKGVEYTPIASEVKTIASWNQPKTIILIDDARLFDGTDYPKLDEFLKVVKKLLPNHEVRVENDIIRITSV